MAHPTIDNRIEQLTVEHFAEDDSIFCLSQIERYEASNPDAAEKVRELLEGRIIDSEEVLTLECNMPQCSRTITPATVESGRKISSECFAASYCLKKSFEEVSSAPSVEEGRAKYRDIMDSLDSFTSKYSAGNLCARLTCELSAGVSMDMVPGTAGICETSGLENQPPLPVTE